MSAKARPTTLFLTTSYPRSDGDFGGHFVLSHARREQASGRSVRVLTFGTPAEGYTPAEDIEVVWLGGGALFGAPGVLPRLAERPARALLLGVPLLRALGRLCPRPRYQRVVGHFLLPSGWPLGVWFARRRGGPSASLEVVAHGSDVRLFERLPRWLRRHVTRELMHVGATLCFVSSELRARMAQSLGAPELQRYVEAQPVSAAPLDLPELPSRAEARQALGIVESETLVVIVGRLTTGKRTEVALGAAELLPGARIVVIGDGPDAARLRALHSNVSFLGALARERALAWVRAADILLSASRLEGAPTVVREARLLGVPVVAAAAGDLVEWSVRDPELWVVA